MLEKNISFMNIASKFSYCVTDHQICIIDNSLIDSQLTLPQYKKQQCQKVEVGYEPKDQCNDHPHEFFNSIHVRVYNIYWGLNH